MTAQIKFPSTMLCGRTLTLPSACGSTPRKMGASTRVGLLSPPAFPPAPCHHHGDIRAHFIGRDDTRNLGVVLHRLAAVKDLEMRIEARIFSRRSWSNPLMTLMTMMSTATPRRRRRWR